MWTRWWRPRPKPLVMDHLASEIENVVAFHGGRTGLNVKEIFEAMATVAPVTADVREAFMRHHGVKAPRAAEAARVRNEIIEVLERAVGEAYKELEGLFGDRVEIANIEKQLLLRSIDLLWVEHLSAMSKLRSAVGLSGYAQRDPLVEYKRESFAMFQVMLSEVQKQVVYSIFKIKEAVKIASAPSLADRVPAKEGGASSSPIKLGRNDLCHCGSGKKYKRCHGI